MGPITSVRSQLLTSGALPHPPASAPLQGGAAAPSLGRSAPVAEPQPVAPPRPPRARPEAEQLQAPPEPAVATAEAARLAYIRASIAAGLNPLPLPGR
ncbi:hypothetical protein [Tabrizicola sp.]|uniref:hypothetical protein n=1 Tax=Tabrizicola sp. TaxID=2005166 RepID=UPI003F363D05